jgi:hypothetical protein
LRTQPGETVLDLAAAPVGKTPHLAALMENRGRIVAVEAVRVRFFRLKANLALGGATIAETYLMDDRRYGGDPAETPEGGRCWQGEDVTCLARPGDQSLVVRAPDLATAGLVRAAIGGGRAQSRSG